MDDDSLVATRARRANAGSRLKLLIELEERASGVQQLMIYTEDDENVQLLFQEDENDEEFEEPDVSGEEDDEGDNSQPEDGEEESLRPDEENNGSDTEVAVNSDEMLSDSDLSVSEDDDSEGERELEKEERAKKRKHKLKTIIPAIKKARPAPVKAPVKPKVKHSELLLLSERRASSRKSALQNKQELLEKLQEDESRRAKLTPVVRVKERELTQEERLAEAKETETQNIISLNLFMQQEIVKKERQKLLFQQRRPKLRNVVRLFSAETYVTPLDEIEDARHVQDLFERKKRGRRRKNQQDGPDVKRPGDIDEALPYYQREMAEKRRIEAEKAEEKRKLEEARAIKRKKLEEERAERKRILEEERLARKKAKEERLKEYDVDVYNDPNTIKPQKGSPNVEQEGEMKELEELPEHDDAPLPESEGLDESEVGLETAEKDKDEGAEVDGDEMVVDDIGEVDDGKIVDDLESEPASDSLKESDQKEDVEVESLDATPIESPSADHPDEKIEQEMKSSENSPEISEEQIPTTENADGEDSQIKKEDSEDVKVEAEAEAETEDQNDTPGDKVEKKVTFADVHEESTQDGEDVEETKAKLEEAESEIEEHKESRSATPIYRSQADGTIFEGPVQHVARNLIFLLNFDEEDRWGLTDLRIKTALFGDDFNLTESRRFQDVKTIFRSSLRLDNPYAAPKEEKEDELLSPVTKITEESGLFDVLRKLPRFGDKEIYEEEEEIENKDDSSEIRIRTEAPTGLYLPNGNKKICLISGKEVRYFDPATGLPYGNKDVYQAIKTVELGVIPWYSIGKDQNTYGAVEIYLNRREGSRHAKGVPEGFDGY